MMRRAVAIALVALALAAARAEAVTAKDIIDLARAGLGDEVLLALIEVDGGVFTIDTATLTRLKAAGVSDRVIEAMVRSGRSRQADLPPAVYEPEPLQQQPVQPPQVIVIEHDRPVVEQVAVPVPYYVTVPANRSRGRVSRGQVVHGQIVHQPLDQPLGFGTYLSLDPPRPKPQPPVYWGWGGKLRPDAWKPAGHAEQAKPEPKAGSRDRR